MALNMQLYRQTRGENMGIKLGILLAILSMGAFAQTKVDIQASGTLNQVNNETSSWYTKQVVAPELLEQYGEINPEWGQAEGTDRNQSQHLLKGFDFTLDVENQSFEAKARYARGMSEKFVSQDIQVEAIKFLNKDFYMAKLFVRGNAEIHLQNIKDYEYTTLIDNTYTYDGGSTKFASFRGKNSHDLKTYLHKYQVQGGVQLDNGNKSSFKIKANASAGLCSLYGAVMVLEDEKESTNYTRPFGDSQIPFDQAADSNLMYSYSKVGNTGSDFAKYRVLASATSQVEMSKAFYNEGRKGLEIYVRGRYDRNFGKRTCSRDINAEVGVKKAIGQNNGYYGGSFTFDDRKFEMEKVQFNQNFSSVGVKVFVGF
jgi:hypothetical protein